MGASVQSRKFPCTGMGPRFDGKRPSLGACRAWGFGDNRSRFRVENRGRRSLESRFETTEPPVLRRKMRFWTERPSAACSRPRFWAPNAPRRSGRSPATALLPQDLAHPSLIGRGACP